MERLTKYDKDGTAIAPEFADETYIMQDDHDRFTGYINSPFVDRLAELEDKLESGRLVEQPCKVGDTVWLVKYLTCEGTAPVEIFDEWIIDKIVITKRGILYCGTHEGTEDYRTFDDDEYKVNWFTDKVEAEEKLKELKGEL